jgi:hypothetical protein
VRFEFTDDDRIEDTQRDTHVHTETYCLGNPELASSKMEVVSRERKRTQTIRKGKHEQMKTTKTTTTQSRRKGWPMRDELSSSPYIGKVLITLVP